MVEPKVKVYLACTSVLYAKFLLVTIIQSTKTFRAGGRPPEDAKLAINSKKLPKQNFALNHDEADPKILKARMAEQRYRRVVLNDLESIPFALFIFGGGILAGSNTRVHNSALIVYTLARCVHSYVYIHGLQPHRVILWGIGVLATVVGAANGIAAIL